MNDSEKYKTKQSCITRRDYIINTEFINTVLTEISVQLLTTFFKTLGVQMSKIVRLFHLVVFMGFSGLDCENKKRGDLHIRRRSNQ